MSISINILERNRIKKIIDIIKNDDINEFKSYIRDNNIQIKNLNNKNYDLLINSIENDASIDMIDSIINYGKYKSLNYSIFKSPDYVEKSPLSTAIGRNNFKLADYLIDYGADINYIGNDFQDMTCTFQNINYIIKNKINIEKLIYNIIKENKNIFLIRILRNLIYSNVFILNLINIYKQHTPLTNEQLYNTLLDEKQKFQFNESTYIAAINNYNYDAISILYDYDLREKSVILNDFYNIFNQNEYAKLDILNNIKNTELKVQIENQFIKDLENINTDLDNEDNIYKLIKNNNLTELKNYVKKNGIQLFKYNDKYNGNHDFLKIAIENNVSLKMISYIIDQCHYEKFNYDININRKPSTLLYYVLSHHQY
eukprot:jgi/Orpsp1_1/1185019/evm.model.c7180000092000.1